MENMMPGAKKRTESGTFVVDGKYLRTQAKEAAGIFLAPLSGVYVAAFGSARMRVTPKSKKRA
jgi:hypothetical protein